MNGPCDCCNIALHYPDLTKKTYSMGCVYCGARHLRDWPDRDISAWEYYGVTYKQASEARQQGEFFEPQLRRRRA